MLEQGEINSQITTEIIDTLQPIFHIICNLTKLLLQPLNNQRTRGCLSSGLLHHAVWQKFTEVY